MNHSITKSSKTASVLVFCLFLSSSVSIALSGFIITALYWLLAYRLLKHPETRRMDVPIVYPFAAFIGAIGISMWVNTDSWEDLKTLRELWRYFLPFVIWMDFQNVPQQKLAKAFLAILTFLSCYGVVQHYHGVDLFRPEGKKKVTPYTPDHVETGRFHAKGNFSHHLTYANYLLLAFPVFLSLVHTSSLSLYFRIALALGSLSMLAGVFYSLGRSAWAGALVALGILIWRLPKKWVGGLILLGVLVVGSYISTSQPGSSFDTYQQQIDSAIKARIDSIFTLRHHRDRAFLWESGWMAIQDHFWWGIGHKKDAQVMPDYRQQVEAKRQHTFLNKASAGVHNIYLQIWLNYGVFGLLAYLAWWIIWLGWLAQSIQKTRPSQMWEKSLLWGFLASSLGFMASGIFENNFYDGEVHTLLFLWMGWGLYLGRYVRGDIR